MSDGTWGNAAEMPAMGEGLPLEQLRRMELAEERIRELQSLPRAGGGAQEVKAVEQYDDAEMLNRLKALGLEADGIYGRLFLLENEIKKLKKWWREWPIAFRVVFASGDPFKSSTAQIRVNGGSISLSGMMHYVETTLLNIGEVLNANAKRVVLYYRLVSAGNDGWTPSTGGFVGVAINESYPYIMPESTILYSGSTISAFEYWFPLAVFEQGWSNSVGDGKWSLTQAKIGLLTAEANLPDQARLRAGQTVSGTASDCVFFAGGKFVAQGTTILPAEAISVTSSCVLYLEVTAVGATEYAFAWKKTAGIDTYPTDAEGYARIPLARVLVANGLVREVFQLRRGGAIALQGKVP